jgi:hypothetical protein
MQLSLDGRGLLAVAAVTRNRWVVDIFHRLFGLSDLLDGQVVRILWSLLDRLSLDLLEWIVFLAYAEIEIENAWVSDENLALVDLEQTVANLFGEVVQYGVVSNVESASFLMVAFRIGMDPVETSQTGHLEQAEYPACFFVDYWSYVQWQRCVDVDQSFD